MVRQILALLGAVGSGTIAAVAAALVLFGWVTSVTLHAAEGPLARFFGTYVGKAEVEDRDGAREERDMDIVIAPYDGGLRLYWVNVTLVDGRVLCFGDD